MVARTTGSFGAGLVTTVFMTLTIVAQFFTPLGLRRMPPARLLLLSLLFLSLPSVVYALDVPPWVLIGAAAVRGVGFGLMTIVCTAMVSFYAEPGKQGAALGLYGLSTSLTGIIAPSLGVLILDEWGGVPVAVAAFAIPLVGVLFLRPIQRATPSPVSSRHEDPDSQPDKAWTWPRFAPLAIFVPVAIAYGGSYTFLPLFSSLAAIGLLMLGVGFAVGRIVGGRLVDRTRSAVVTGPFALVAALGVVMVAWMPTPAMGTKASVSLGYGGTASASLAGMMASVAPSQYGFVSTAWNLSFDLGIAVGGLGLGLVIAPLGFAGGSTVLAAVMALVVVVFFAPLTRLRRYAGSPS
jgi:predicted MFS family arabinose efflux permease